MSESRTPEERARRRAEDWMGLLWHGAVFAIVNTFLWVQDIVGGGGVDWAYWVTIPWGIGMLFHLIAYQIDSRGYEDRKYEMFLSQERERAATRREEHVL